MGGGEGWGGGGGGGDTQIGTYWQYFTTVFTVYKNTSTSAMASCTCESVSIGCGKLSELIRMKAAFKG